MKTSDIISLIGLCTTFAALYFAFKSNKSSESNLELAKMTKHDLELDRAADTALKNTHENDEYQDGLTQLQEELQHCLDKLYGQTNIAMTRLCGAFEEFFPEVRESGDGLGGLGHRFERSLLSVYNDLGEKAQAFDKCADAVLFTSFSENCLLRPETVEAIEAVRQLIPSSRLDQLHSRVVGVINDLEEVFCKVVPRIDASISQARKVWRGASRKTNIIDASVIARLKSTENAFSLMKVPESYLISRKTYGLETGSAAFAALYQYGVYISLLNDHCLFRWISSNSGTIGEYFDEKKLKTGNEKSPPWFRS